MCVCVCVCFISLPTAPRHNVAQLLHKIHTWVSFYTESLKCQFFSIVENILVFEVTPF